MSDLCKTLLTHLVSLGCMLFDNMVKAMSVVAPAQAAPNHYLSKAFYSSSRSDTKDLPRNSDEEYLMSRSKYLRASKCGQLLSKACDKHLCRMSNLPLYIASL